MKGMFVQGMTVLTAQRPTHENMAEALAQFGIRNHKLNEEPNWFGGQETWVVPYRPEANGNVLIHYHDRQWPDSMGDPKGASDDEKMCFAAWSMGHFGPMAWPGMLHLAKHMARMVKRDSAVRAAEAHTGCLQILTTYAVGIPDDAPIWPKSRDAMDEFEHALHVAEALLDVPGSLAYFNANGAVLRTQVQMFEAREQLRKGMPPVLLASEPRVIKLEQARMYLVDVCALNQMRDDIPDVAAEFNDRYDIGQVVEMVVNVAVYLVQAGSVIEDGHTIDGPGGVWRAELTEKPPAEPSRPTLVFRPQR